MSGGREERAPGPETFLRALVDTGEAPDPSVRRALALALVLPPFVVLQLIHWVAFRLDDLLFPGYRDVAVEEPLFVVGLPRSGTTFLHRVLALDEERFTTLRLWELLLAPAVVERKAARALGAVDRALGRPFGRLLEWVEGRVLSFMDDVHPTALSHPEEDYLFLLPAFAAFILVLAFPGHPRLWAVARLDLQEDGFRRELVAFYGRCLQRHLYVVGTDKRVLSKNPSFTPFLSTLAEAFPDARFIGCVRDPCPAVASQLSSLEAGAAFFGWSVAEPRWRDPIVEMLAFYGERLVAVLPALPEARHAWAPLGRVSGDVEAEVGRVYARFGWTPSEAFGARLAEAGRRSRRYVSRHEHRLGDYGLVEADVRARFAALVDRFGFEAAGARDA
ncbi:MAG TPA: sulfotransferase [Longimicrobiales bacterium]|nr:sulfotransferase [Longimicrobiales bacterium]